MDPAGPFEAIGIEAPRSNEPRPTAADVSAAREGLEEARSKFDSALAGMDMDGDEAMATSQLVVLLAGAVSAKKRLDALEALPVSEDE